MDQAATLNVDLATVFPSGFTVAPVIDVRMAAGSVLVVFGPSGAGKTTILRQIAGLDRPERGRVIVDGDVWCDVERRIWTAPQRRRLGIVMQEPALFPHLTVAENVAYGARLRSLAPVPGSGARHGCQVPVPGTGARHPVAEIARVLGLEGLKNRLPGRLSGGEARRVAIARALAADPRLVLLDEPLAALDAPTRLRLRHDLRALLRRTGIPGLLVTHDRAEAMAMGDQLAVVIAGRIRQVGAVPDVFSRPIDAEAAAALGIEAVIAARIVSSSNGLTDVAIGATTIVAVDRDGLAAGSNVYACIRAEDVMLETAQTNRDAPGGVHVSARNHLAAEVVSIHSEGAVDRVSLDCGFALDAIITRQSREELGLTPGSAVTAAVKATSVHLVARDD